MDRWTPDNDWSQIPQFSTSCSGELKREEMWRFIVWLLIEPQTVSIVILQWLRWWCFLCFLLEGWLVVLGINATLTAKVISMAVGDAHVFPGFLTLVLTKPFFLKPTTTFLTCFCRGEGLKYARKKVRLNRGSNVQQPGHESDTSPLSHPGGPFY